MVVAVEHVRERAVGCSQRAPYNQGVDRANIEHPVYKTMPPLDVAIGVKRA